jgi:hypothetical protein
LSGFSFGNIKIRDRIIVILLIFSLISIFFLYFTYQTITQVKIGSANYEKIAAYQAAVQSIALLKSDINEERSVFLSLFYEKNPDKIKQTQTRLDEYAHKIQSDFAAYKKNTDIQEGIEIFSNAEAIWQKYQSTNQTEVMENIQKADLSSAIEITDGPQVQRIRRCMEQLSSAVDIIHLKISDVEQVEQSVKENIAHRVFHKLPFINKERNHYHYIFLFFLLKSNFFLPQFFFICMLLL